MTEQEEDELRSELRATRTANAYLFLAIEALGKVVFDMPRALTTHGQEQAALQDAIRKTTLELDEALKSAAKCIWDENGNPL
ncbi:MAG TPA: hypothetical protein DC061_16985 [Gemmobacter sp.]|nr:hypothetical protein [Gemmobacter sp.]